MKGRTAQRTSQVGSAPLSNIKVCWDIGHQTAARRHDAPRLQQGKCFDTDHYREMAVVYLRGKLNVRTGEKITEKSSHEIHVSGRLYLFNDFVLVAKFVSFE